jgi:hypothetical protein
MAEELGSLDPAMTGDDLMIVADQNRVGKAKPLVAVGDLADLLSGMGTRIASRGSQVLNGHIRPPSTADTTRLTRTRPRARSMCTSTKCGANVGEGAIVSPSVFGLASPSAVTSESLCRVRMSVKVSPHRGVVDQVNATIAGGVFFRRYATQCWPH